MGKSGEMVIVRVSKDVRLLGKSGEMSILRIRKDVRLRGKSGDHTDPSGTESCYISSSSAP